MATQCRYSIEFKRQIARDGETLLPATRFKADTINIGPG